MFRLALDCLFTVKDNYNSDLPSASLALANWSCILEEEMWGRICPKKGTQMYIFKNYFFYIKNVFLPILVQFFSLM